MLNLSIVIVNYRSWSKLEGCLLSIYQQKQKVKKVIIVDNLSDDGVIESFIKKGFSFITTENELREPGI